MSYRFHELDRVVKEKGNFNINHIREVFGVSQKTVYNWKKIYLEDKKYISELTHKAFKRGLANRT